MKHIILGKVGEAKAQYYAKQQGFEIVEANYKNFAGEIDLIYLDGTTLVFFDVMEIIDDDITLIKNAF